jgi:muramoyltetrapeptide carboxypeptidase
MQPLRPKPVKPKALRPGGTLAVCSPAGPTREPADAFEKGMALLVAEGFQVKLMPNARNQLLYTAGNDAERLADLQAAFSDPEVNGILCSRGGYGCMRLLPALDLDIVRRNPKVFIGFSDVTVLHTAFYQQTGLVGFYGPMLTSNLINGEPYSQQELFRIIRGEHYFPYTIPNRDPYTCFNPGVTEAPLIGGNLSLLAALCGTPWQPRTAGHILFIEDWHESYYSLDRQFQQLRLAGLFDNIAGLILCDFSEIPEECNLSLAKQLQRLVGDLPVPCGYGFSVGHGEETATFPIGVQVRFDAEAGTVTLLESPVQ